MNRQVKIAFDMDETLIRQTSESLDVPNYPIIDLFRKFENLGCDMYIWSGGGVDYAKRWADKLGLKATVVEKGSFQPDIAVDDMDLDFRKVERSLGRVNLQV